jgi:hypothetical protein
MRTETHPNAHRRVGIRVRARLLARTQPDPNKRRRTHARTHAGTRTRASVRMHTRTQRRARAASSTGSDAHTGARMPPSSAEGCRKRLRRHEARRREARGS